METKGTQNDFSCCNVDSTGIMRHLPDRSYFRKIYKKNYFVDWDYLYFKFVIFVRYKYIFPLKIFQVFIFHSCLKYIILSRILFLYTTLVYNLIFYELVEWTMVHGTCSASQKLQLTEENWCHFWKW